MAFWKARGASWTRTQAALWVACAGDRGAEPTPCPRRSRAAVTGVRAPQRACVWLSSLLTPVSGGWKGQADVKLRAIFLPSSPSFIEK